METKTVLITGANKSIGFEVARLLAGKGYHVFLGSRDKERGEKAVGQLAGLPGTVELVVLDVSSEDSVREAFHWISQRVDKLDVLVNNAGILGAIPQPATATADATMHAVFETNVFGAIRMVRYFIPLLKKSPQPRIVNVTSELGSLALHNDPDWIYYSYKGAAYGPSKSALNAYTIALAFELKDTPFKVNAVNPGHTATDFNNFRGTKAVGDAGALVAQYAMLDEHGPTGKFISDYGDTPW